MTSDWSSRPSNRGDTGSKRSRGFFKILSKELEGRIMSKVKNKWWMKTWRLVFLTIFLNGLRKVNESTNIHYIQIFPFLQNIHFQNMISYPYYRFSLWLISLYIRQLENFFVNYVNYILISLIVPMLLRCISKYSFERKVFRY